MAFGQDDLVYLEENGLVVIEPERIAELPEGWVRGPGSGITAPNLDDANDATGAGFITWQGNQFLGDPGNGLIMIPLQIANPGTYRFEWRNQVGNGTSTTDHNDTWVKIEAESFYGQRTANVVCPKGLDPAANDCIGGSPNGSGSDGWFKVYSSGANTWRFSTSTSDNDAHAIYARFDRADVYFLLLSARSSFHVIDRIVLHSDAFAGNPRDLGLPPSAVVQTGVVFIDGFEN
ncbi:MAG: hypothetical protein AAGA23_22435 [Pseudomonadota bacterium]